MMSSKKKLSSMTKTQLMDLIGELNNTITMNADKSSVEDFSATAVVEENPIIKSLLDRMEKMEKTVVDLANENKLLKDQIKKIKSEMYEVDDELIKLGKEMFSMQQFSRRWNIEIENIPDEITQNELSNTVQTLLNNIEVNVNDGSFETIHRLQKPRDSKQPASVIVRFKNRNDAYYSLKNKKKVKDIDKSEVFGPLFKKPIFIHESLCPHYKEILKFCKSRKDAGEIHKVWSFKGIVNFLFSDDDNEKPTKVYHYDELWDLFE